MRAAGEGAGEEGMPTCKGGEMIQHGPGAVALPSTRGVLRALHLAPPPARRRGDDHAARGPRPPGGPVVVATWTTVRVLAFLALLAATARPVVPRLRRRPAAARDHRDAPARPTPPPLEDR